MVCLEAITLKQLYIISGPTVRFRKRQKQFECQFIYTKTINFC